MKNRKGFMLILIFGIVAASCTKQTQDTSNLYIPTPSEVTAKTTLDELIQGRALYIDNCSRCHGLYSDESFTSNKWKSIMTSMAPKTPMTASEVNFVTKYVTMGK